MNIFPRKNISWEIISFRKHLTRKKYIMGSTFHISSRQNTVLYLLGRTFPMEKQTTEPGS